jgi:hypothetical protein
MKRLIGTLTLALILFTTAVPADAGSREEADPGAIVMDVLLIRPLGLISATLGTGVFIIALPFAIPSGSMATIGEKLVLDPLRFTFTRPLGTAFYE